MIYFDNAATTPLDPQVIEQMNDVMLKHYGNPSSIHTLGREARVLVESARKQIASYVDVSPSEIIFTSSGTEAINTAIIGAVDDLGVKHIITSPVEHHAVLHTVEKVQKKNGITVTYLSVDSCGLPDFIELERILSETNAKTLVCIMHANNETGSLLPLKEASAICEKNNALLLVDTVQTIGKYAISLSKQKIHFATCSAHKFHGPKGTGFLYLNGEVSISPYILGGGQERNMRSGTENVYGICGMAKALEIAHKEMDKNQNYISSLKKYFSEKLINEFSGINFNAESDKKGLYNILNVSFPKTSKSEMMLYGLDIDGIAVSGGSACSSGSVSASHVLGHIGADTDKPAIRFSLSKFNTIEEIDTCLNVLKKILKNEN